MDNTSKTVSVREISNGYIKTVSTCGPNSYDSTETYSKTEPSLDSSMRPESGRSPRGGNSLRAAVRVLKHGR